MISSLGNLPGNRPTSTGKESHYEVAALYLMEELGVIDSHKAIAEDVYILFGSLNEVVDWLNPVS